MTWKIVDSIYALQLLCHKTLSFFQNMQRLYQANEEYYVECMWILTVQIQAFMIIVYYFHHT